MRTTSVRDWSRVLFAAIALGSLPAVSVAQEVRLKRSVQGGSNVLISGHARWNNECSLKELGQVYLDKAPRHGIVCVRYGEVNIEQVFGAASNACMGHTVRGVLIVYYANSGPAAADDLRYTVRYADVQRTVRVTIDIHPGQRREALPKDLAEMPSGYTQPLERVAPCSQLVS
jgi:hypothetical protein